MPKASSSKKKTSSRRITARALMQIKVPGEPDISPDNRRVAFTVSETDWEENTVASHIYLQRANARSGRDEPRQLTFGKGSESMPRFSPAAGRRPGAAHDDNARWLAFLRNPPENDHDGDEDNEERHQQVWRLPMDGGEAEPWTDSPEGVIAYTWLPDGAGIAYLAREPRPKPLQTRYERMQEDELDAVVEREEKFRVQVWTIDHDKKPKLVHPGDFGIGEIAVSPDGKRIAFSTNYSGEPNDYHKVDIFVVGIASGKVTQLTEGPGGKFHPRWSPDGKEIAYLRTLDPTLSYSQINLFMVDSAGGESRLVTGDFPHDITGWPGFDWAADGSFWVQAAVGVATHLYRWEGERIEEVVAGESHIHTFRAGGPDRSLIAYVQSAADQPPELFVNGRQITGLNEKWREEHRVAKTETVRWQADDGLEIEGLLTLPVDVEPPYPTILSIHGGPYGRSLRSLTPYSVSQIYASRGYAVFSPNYRGSEGYGDEFGKMNRQDLGGGDYRDIISGIDYLVDQGLADPDRLGVTGGSYGGYMTNWIIGHTDRFKAAVSKFGIFSLITDFSNSEAPRWEQEYLGGFYWENLDRYLAQSPSTFLANIKTPVLIIHGESDANTFISNSREMYTALRSLGRTVEYVHYPREGHGLSEPNHRLDEARRTLAWFDRYLLPEGCKPARIGDKVANESGWELMVTSATAGLRYAGQSALRGEHYLEIVFVLRVPRDRRARFTLRSQDIKLHPGEQLQHTEDGVLRPIGFPIDALGETVLAETRTWSLSLAPPKNDKNMRSLAAPLALVFSVPSDAEVFTLTVANFPPIVIEPAPADGGDEPDEE